MSNYITTEEAQKLREQIRGLHRRRLKDKEIDIMLNLAGYADQLVKEVLYNEYCRDRDAEEIRVAGR